MGRFIKSNKIPIIIIILCLIAGVVVVSMILDINKTYEENDKYVEDINNEYIGETSNEEISGETYEFLDIDWASLRSRNGDVCAYIELTSDYKYPVLQGETNDTYLRKNIDKSYAYYGSIFLDYRNSRDFSDDLSVIYGHHMKSGTMFAELRKYKSREYLDEHPYILLYTPTVVYKLTPYAVNVIDGEITDLFEGAYEEYIKERVSSSIVNCGVEMSTSYKTVSLYTCDYTYDNAKLVVSCKSEVIKTYEGT